MKCALCGFEFDAMQADASCASCGIGKRCGLVKCPRCHYETPAESEVDHKKDTDPVTVQESCLTEWPLGVKARVSRVSTTDRVALRKMIAMGVLPPAEILVHKSFPSYVLDIGNGRFSIDRELASLIFVHGI